MSKFVYNPNEYSENTFTPIPEGDYRVRISDVTYQVFSNGKPGYEITLDVNGYNNKLWHYITIDEDDTKKTNQRLGSFFNSFGVTDYNLDHYSNWRGATGAGRVKHNIYEGKTIARVAFCLSRNQQDKLNTWNDDCTPFTANEHNSASAPARHIAPMRFNGFSF